MSVDDSDRSLSGKGVRVIVAVTHWVAMSARHGGNRELMGKPRSGMIGDGGVRTAALHVQRSGILNDPCRSKIVWRWDMDSEER